MKCGWKNSDTSERRGVSVQRTQTTPNLHSPSSVLDVITESVNTVLAHLWVVLIPLGLDVAYVLGREVTIEPVMRRIAAKVSRSSFTGSDRISGWVSDAAGIDITGIFSLILPTMFGGVDAGATYDPIVRSPVEIHHGAVAILAILGAIVLAALAYGLFGAWLSDVGLNRTRTWSERLRALPGISSRIAAVFALGIGIFLLFCLPMLLAWGATSIAGLDLKGLFLPLIVILATAMMVLFYFAPEAIFVAGASPAQALRMSTQVVRNNGWITLGFVGATTLLSWGLSDLWERMATNPPGLMLAMSGSAFAGSALALAAMLFFNERWQSLETERKVQSMADSQKPAA